MADGERARSEDDGLSIGFVSRLTGISTHALRAWERRYHAVSPARSAGGARRYSRAEVTRLRTIKVLVDRGHSISRVSSLPLEELEALIALHHDAASSEVDEAAVGDITEALQRLDEPRAARTLTRAALASAPEQLLGGVLRPALARSLELWREGLLTGAREQVAAELFRTRLMALLSAERPPGSAVVCATPRGQEPELAALLMTALASAAGWRAVYPGRAPDADDVIAASRLGRADAIALWVLVPELPEVATELERIARSCSPGVPLLIVGAPSGAKGLPRDALTLADEAGFERWLMRAPGPPLA